MIRNLHMIMKSVCISTKFRFVVTMIFFILLTETLISCTDVIDPSAANSLSAIVAVIGEYFYASIVLVFVALLWILRPAGIALILLGILGQCNYVELSANSLLLLCIGVVMSIVSFAPIKQYKPMVIISKHFKMPKNEKVIEKHNGYREFFIQLLVGFIMLIMEYSIFAK